LTGFAVYGFHTHRQSNSMLVCFFFGTFFFQTKKKVERFPFFKRLFLKALSVRKEKVRQFPFFKVKNKRPVGRQSKALIVFHPKVLESAGKMNIYKIWKIS
jgi:hypothetical protein